MSSLTITILLSMFNILLFSKLINGISLQEAFFVHQKVKSELNRPRILSDHFGPTWHSNNSPVLHWDSSTGNIRVLRPQETLTLQQILEKARQKLIQKEARNQRALSSHEIEPSSPPINRFNHLRPNLNNQKIM